MSLRHAILGWLSWRPASGYDLKKAIADCDFQPWSGNNNQIYTALLQLAAEGLVHAQTEHREDGPTRKIYTITAGGSAELARWVRDPASQPEWHNAFLQRLAWADTLSADEMRQLIDSHREQVRTALLVARHKKSGPRPMRSAREALLWDLIADNPCAVLEAELAWLDRLRLVV